MIELKFTGICEGCREADLEFKTMFSGTDKIWAVACKHDGACDRAYRKRIAQDIADEMRRTQEEE